MLPKKILLSVVLCAACGGTPTQTGSAIPPPPSPPPAAPAPPAASPVAPAARAPVTSDPDTPKGADAARDAELAAKAQPFIDAFVNSAGDLTPEGKRLIFSSSRDGIPQLYVSEVAKPEAPAVRLVTTPERIGPFGVTLDGKYVLLLTDKGADENWTIWRVDLDGKNLTELTPGETLNRDQPVQAEKLPDTIFYSARKKEEASSAVYSLAVAGGKAPTKLYSTKGFGILGDVSADGKTLLYERIPSQSENHLEIVDVATGNARELYPGSAGGKVTITYFGFSADEKRVLVATDTGGEQRVLLALDAKTGKELGRYTDPASPTASITGCATPRKRTKLACGVSIGNHNEVRLLDAATLKPTVDVKLPPGSGFATAFSNDATNVVVAWSTPNAPTDLYLVAAKTGQVTPVRKEARPSIQGAPQLEVTTAEVPAHDGLKIPVHAYLPPEARAGKKVPVIVTYHGGPAGVSMIRWNPMTRFFTSLGYAWVEPNVRGSSGYGRAYVMADDGPKRLEALKDIETTGRWVAQQPWADPKRLVIFGGSYGGYTTLIGLSRYSAQWRAGVDLFGVVNWTTFMKSTSGVIRELFVTEIGDPDKDQALFDALSPIKDVDKIKAPLFVYAGANDPRVPRSEDDQVVKALRERGVSVEYMVAPNEGHSLSRRENQITFSARAARFLEKALAQ